MKIPFVDLKAQYLGIKEGIDSAMQQVIDETAFIRGKYVKEFEEAYAEAYGVKHCIGVANGTDAIYIALKMLDIGPGDEVITVANSWISTSEAITQTGARPVFIDIDDHFCINTDRIAEKVTERTRAILPVHLFGQSAELDSLLELCRRHGLYMVEDCAQAHFAEYKGQRVGTFGIAGTFSFFPGKNLGAYGDAGAIIINDDDYATRVRMYANHGAKVKHQHEFEGVNSRLDGLQAAILSVKLPHIQRWSELRLQHAKQYNKLLSGIDGVEIPRLKENCRHVFHLYVICVEHRDELQVYLKEHGVQTGIHYPTALPFLNAYRYLKHTPEDFPLAFKRQSEILSLPMYPEMTEEMIVYVADTVRAFYEKSDN
ncbi:MAG: DegT/DnrJ/EryC1/StrS family aminotransferase [Candidatus Zixiibacteriota bacterium]